MKPRAGLDPETVMLEAVKLVDRDGWHNLSMGPLAKRLGVKTPSLYNHVDGLPGLQLMLMGHAVDQLRAALTDATVGRSGEDAIHALADAHRAFIKRHPGLAEATVAAPPKGNTVLEKKAAAAVEVCFKALQGYALSPRDNVHAVRCLRAAVHGFAMMETQGGFGLKVDVEESFGWLVDSLVQGLKVLAHRRR